MPSRSSSRPGGWRGGLSLLVPSLLCLLLSSVRAERAPSCQQDAGCWRELNRGSKLAEAADYPAALAAFEQAYSRVPDPRLQINIGRSLHRLGRYDEAIAAFERYQATAPASAPAEEQEVVRRFLTESQQAKQPSLPPPPAPPPPPKTPIYKKWWFWTVLGAAVVGGVVTGVVVGTWPRSPSEEQAERIRFGLRLAF